MAKHIPDFDDLQGRAGGPVQPGEQDRPGVNNSAGHPMQRIERERQRPTPTRHINDSCMQQTEGKPPRLAQRLPHMHE